MALEKLHRIARDLQHLLSAQEPLSARREDHAVRGRCRRDLDTALIAPLGGFPPRPFPNQFPVAIDLPEASQRDPGSVIADVSGEPIHHATAPRCAGVGRPSWPESWVLLIPTSPFRRPAGER